ncbi:MAG: TIGR03619 family F420-dependent LLM class oxidoreductase [Chloroflexota bacterium]|nr:TIGR03619 family F420-dependent LLM class oxidoreductase [Chloroflexota bacterium]
MQTKSGVKLGIAVPQGFADGRVDMPLVRRFVARAEALGYDDLWVAEQITGTIASLEPVGLLAYVAALTERVRIGASVFVSTLRNPVQFAKALGTLDHLSEGRLTVGLGLGTNTRKYPAYRLAEERRVARFTEGVRIMKALWTQDAADYEGSWATLSGVKMEPKPVQKPHPPLWFGARAPDALQRTARLADGWMGAGSSTNEAFIREHNELMGMLEEEGRDPATFGVSKRVYLAIDTDEARGWAGLREWIGGFYGNPDLAEQWSIVGSADYIAEKLAELVEAGANHLLLNPVHNYIEHLEVIAEEVAPRI